MADEQLGPEHLTTRGVPSSKRGYDKRVVDALLGEAREHWQRLQDDYDQLRSTIEASGGIEFLGRELASVGKEVGEILAVAQQAAEGMRTRARDEAERIDRESSAAAAAVVAEAEAQAFELRRGAWEAGMDLLDSAMQTAERIIDAGKDDALLIKAQAEKDAHRHISGAEREASDLIRQARYEADRQLNQAREVAQQIIDRAVAPHYAAGEEAPAPLGSLESAQREELLAEIERLRIQRSIESVKVFDNEPRVPAVSRESEATPYEPDGIDLSDVLAAEVEEMRAEPATVKIRVDPPAQVFGSEDDVGTLFEALRTTGEVETVTVAEPLPTDPFELRDHLLAPVIEEGTRNAKRRIVDLQNVALDGLRGAGWEPNPPEIAGELRAVLESMIHKAASAGATAARPLAGLYGSVSDPGERPGRLIRSMAAALSGHLAASLEDAGGPEQAAEAVSRVFRAWRSDQAEKWTTSISLAAYHDSLLAAMRAGGVDQVRAVSNGEPCEDCAGPSGLTWRPGREPPNDARIPPSNSTCTCTIAPA